MNKVLLFLLIFSTMACHSPQPNSRMPHQVVNMQAIKESGRTVSLNQKQLKSPVQFYSHKGASPFETALVMNVFYPPIVNLRAQLQNILKKELNYFKGWSPNGEAHITVITPPEFDNILKPFLSIEEIERIAQNYQIQNSSLQVLGIGSGHKSIEGKHESTYYLVVNSENLMNIRQAIYTQFIKNGGSKKAWNPFGFYPHITIGYTKRDLHLQDGVYKDKRSLDSQFQLIHS